MVAAGRQGISKRKREDIQNARAFIEALLPQTGYTVPLAVTMASASQWRVRMRWHEGGETFEVTQSVSSF